MSPKHVDALLSKTQPIQVPCCGYKLHIHGTVVLAIAVDASGKVICVTMVSGHPLIISSAIDSVRQWKFLPYSVKGVKKSFCGKVALHYDATDSEVKYEVIRAR